MIAIEALDKWFGSFHVLKNIHLKVDQGEKLVICGPSGSGKSTLIRCINGLEPFQQGSLRFKNIEVTDQPQVLRQVRQKIGMVFQQFNLFPHLSVLENLTLAPQKVLNLNASEANQRAYETLERVRIREQADKYPAQLSGGQQQRVAIARALCMQPEVLLFDEPTSALDPEMIKEVLDVMQELASSGVTMLCVTHEMAFARNVSDRMIFMEDGIIIEDTPTKEFFVKPKSERSQLFLQQIL